MTERLHQHGPSVRSSVGNNAVDRRMPPYRLRRSAHDYPEPVSSPYVAPLRKRRVSISSRILMGVCAAAAVAILFALFSSDAMRNFMNATASTADVVQPPDVKQAGASPPPGSERKDSAQGSAPANATSDAQNVATASLTPTREEMKNAYQRALQDRAPLVAATGQVAPPVDAISPRLNPNEIAASLKRGDALIASGDLAAARLVLRRAADDGDAQAAIALAGTYDPTVLEKLGVRGTVPDVVTARDWYEKAKKFGATEAGQRLEVLASKHR